MNCSQVETIADICWLSTTLQIRILLLFAAVLTAAATVATTVGIINIITIASVAIFTTTFRQNPLLIAYMFFYF